MALLDFKNRSRYADLITFSEHIVDTEDCTEDFYNPQKFLLFLSINSKRSFTALEKIESDSIVIPHGNTWGFYTPSESSWDKQLSSDHNNSDKQISFEIMSGHGNSEEYRPWTASYTENNVQFCPEPSENYLPSCWQAGEIIKERCLDNENSEAVCDKRAALARQLYMKEGYLENLLLQELLQKNGLIPDNAKIVLYLLLIIDQKALHNMPLL